MKTSIVTVTYDKDLEFLKYNLKSIKKFCNGYHDNVVIIDDHENDCVETQRYLDSIGQKYFVNKEAKHVKRGYVRQQYIKLLCDLYVPDDTDYICHIDSDSIFKIEHTPEVYFIDSKPAIVKNNYELLVEKIKANEQTVKAFLRWKTLTSQFLGWDVEYEFMFRMPLVYPYHLFKSIRTFLEEKHNASLLDLLKDLPVISEYNLLGAYAYKMMHDEFTWIDRHENQEIALGLHKDLIGHYSSRKQQQPARYVDLSIPNNALSQIIDDPARIS
jgi:hypothetical protein